MLLYAVTDSAWLDGRELSWCVEQAIQGGATCVQLREKELPRDEFLKLALSVKAVCADGRVPFIVNDSIEVARACGADGIHVGQDDLACEEARAVMGPDKIVGVSVHSLEDALRAQAQGADYLGVGAVFGTPTKPDATLVSAEDLREIGERVDIPVVAIGGLNRDTIPCLAESGVDGAAVVSAIFAAADIKASTSELRNLVEKTVVHCEKGK